MGIPPARSMEKEERIASWTPVLFIQPFDSLPRQQQKRFILGQRFLGRVPKISKQSEVKVGVTVCQERDFQRLDKVLDVLSACEHGRDNCQSPRFRRDAL